MNITKIKNAGIVIGDGNYSSKYPKSSEFILEGIPFISASDFNGREINYFNCKKISKIMHDTLKKGHVKAKDILLVVRGNGVGKVGYIKDKISDCNINAQLAFIRTDNKIVISEYLYYYLLFNYKELKEFATGSAQPQLTISKLIEYEINIPSLKEQQKIVDILSPIDEKIELNNKINKLLEYIAQLLYKQWFIDFEFPNEYGKLYKSNGGKMVYNEELYREIPEGWEAKKLSEIFKFVKGKKPKMFNETGKIYLTIDAIKNNNYQKTSDSNCISTGKNDILMVMDGASSGSIFRGYEGYLGSTLSKLEMHNESDNDFVFSTLLYKLQKIKEHTTGSAIPHADKKYIENISVFYNKDITILYHKKVKHLYDKICVNNLENICLNKQKQELLNKYFNVLD